MQKFKIKEIIPSSGDKKPTILVDENGTRASGFDTKLKDLTVGTEIEVELVVKGNYNNIKEWSLVTLAPGSASSPAITASDPAAIKLQINSQYRIAAITLTYRLVIAGKIVDSEIDTTANKIYTWLAGRATVAKLDKPVVKAGTTGETAEAIWEELGRGPRDPESITNLGQLFTACHLDFKMSQSDVVKELGYSRKEEITGSMPECYRIIAEPRRE